MRKLSNGTLQMRSVIQARAEHDLGVERDRVPPEPPENLENVRCLFATEQLKPKCGISGVDRDVKRRQALPGNSGKIRFSQIRGCYIVAVQKRQPVVLILDVELLAQVRRKLVKKAEETTVAATTNFKWRSGQAQRVFVRAFPDADGVKATCARFDLKAKSLSG